MPEKYNKIWEAQVNAATRCDTHLAARGGVWNNDGFRPISRFISQMMQDKAIVTMKGE